MKCPRDGQQMYKIANCDDQQEWRCPCGKQVIYAFDKLITEKYNDIHSRI